MDNPLVEDPRIEEVFRRLTGCPNTTDGRHYHSFTPYGTQCIYCHDFTPLPEGEVRTPEDCADLAWKEDFTSSDVIGLTGFGSNPKQKS